MPKGDIETFHDVGLWMNRRQAVDDKPWGLATTKEEAAAVGRSVARAEKVEHIIRNIDGTIGERNSYGNDPSSIRG
ncbi:DUF2188 domain-containing protein [Arthrobacter sp. TMN-37]